jgi:hypothetical protein
MHRVGSEVGLDRKKTCGGLLGTRDHDREAVLQTRSKEHAFVVFMILPTVWYNSPGPTFLSDKCLACRGTTSFVYHCQKEPIRQLTNFRKRASSVDGYVVP